MFPTNSFRGVRAWYAANRQRLGRRPRRRQLSQALVLERFEDRLCLSLTLTQAGQDAGIVLSTFASDFPNSDTVGPVGIGFPSSGGVLVSDFPGNVRLFPTDSDMQSASTFPPAQDYGGADTAKDMAQLNGKMYMTQASLGNVVQINDDGTPNQVIATGLGVPQGMAADPATGRLFIALESTNRIVEVDPATQNVTTFADCPGEPDGVTLAADGRTLYVALVDTGHILGFDTGTAQVVFDSGFIPGVPDGVAVGIGPLAGKLFVNTNTSYSTDHPGSCVVEVDIATNAQMVVADNGSRGDFVRVDPHNGSVLFTQTDEVVRLTFPVGPAQRITAGGFPFMTTAGSPGTLTVTALDQNGHLAAGYTGTVHFTSSDPQAQLPADYTFTPGDGGRHIFTLSLATVGSQSITVTDIADPRLTATQSGITVTPAAAATLRVSLAATTRAGEPRAATVTAVDAYGNTAAGYTGTVHLMSTDAQAALEDDHTFTAADRGRYIFGVQLFTAGDQTVTATDIHSGLTGGANETVTPAPAGAFALTAPANVTAGMPFDVTVTAVDPYGNADPRYQGTVHFTTSDQDPGVVLPADYAFTAGDGGVHTFTDAGLGETTLITAGDQILTAADTAAAITGSATVTVNGAAPPAGQRRPGGGGRAAREVAAADRFFAALPAVELTALSWRRHGQPGDTGGADLV
jgi:hypothetical protein